MAITIEKGDLGQSMILADLLGRRHKVLLPVGEDSRFDLVVYRDGKFERVQCKYDGSNVNHVGVRCASCNNWGIHKYTPEEVDWMAVYHAATKRCYYIPASYLGTGRSLLNLRIAPPKNNQMRGILWAKDFLDF